MRIKYGKRNINEISNTMSRIKTLLAFLCFFAYTLFSPAVFAMNHQATDIKTTDSLKSLIQILSKPHFESDDDAAISSLNITQDIRNESNRGIIIVHIKSDAGLETRDVIAAMKPLKPELSLISPPPLDAKHQNITAELPHYYNFSHQFHTLSFAFNRKDRLLYVAQKSR